MTAEHRHGEGECHEMFARLSEYLDGELSPDFCTQLEGHLADCPPCQAFLESLRRTVRLTEQVSAPPLPEEVRRRVREAFAKMRGA